MLASLRYVAIGIAVAVTATACAQTRPPTSDEIAAAVGAELATSTSTSTTVAPTTTQPVLSRDEWEAFAFDSLANLNDGSFEGWDQDLLLDVVYGICEEAGDVPSPKLWILGIADSEFQQEFTQMAHILTVLQVPPSCPDAGDRKGAEAAYRSINDT